MMLKLARIGGLLTLMLLLLGPAIFTLALNNLPVGAQTVSKVIITEIKLGDGNDITFPDGTKAKDFVSLYNQSAATLDLSGWKLEYIKADGFAGNCSDASWNGGASSVTQLSGELLPGTVSTPIKRSMNDGLAGQIRLIDNTGVIHDNVGWGPTAQCYETAQAALPADNSGKSLQRYLDCDTNVPVDTDNNSLDFALNDAPSPGVLAGPLTDDCSEPEPGPDPDPPTDPPTDPGTGGSGGGSGGPVASCEGIILSELLPNPAGSDTGNEFIELHNPTSNPISLTDCKLQTSANTKIYEFSSEILQPGQYQAFYDSQTGLTLANSAGGTVYLIDSDDSELDQVNYPASLEDDEAWAASDGNWANTYSLTPNGANEIVEEKPCPAGQVRNTETNRCNNILEEAAGLSACPAGKERNVATNRCRNITSLSSTLKACAPDQARNSETNRCRKITSTSSSLTPCKTGQERNPATNRCRKVLSASSSSGVNDVKDILSESSEGEFNWLLGGAAVIGASSYAVWEWRNELFERLSSLKNKFSK